MHTFPLKVHGFPHKLNVLSLLDSLEGLKFDKNGFYNANVHTSYLNKLIYTFLLHFVQHSIWPLHFKFASYAYDVYLVCANCCIAMQGWRGWCYVVVVHGKRNITAWIIVCINVDLYTTPSFHLLDQEFHIMDY